MGSKEASGTSATGIPDTKPYMVSSGVYRDTKRRTLKARKKERNGTSEMPIWKVAEGINPNESVTLGMDGLDSAKHNAHRRLHGIRMFGGAGMRRETNLEGLFLEG